MKIATLADHPEAVPVIAQWYFNQWGHEIPGLTLDTLISKVREKARNRIDFPLTITLHEGDELVAVAELKFRENQNHPEYEHWLGGVYVSESHRGKGYLSVLVDRAKLQVKQLKIDHLYLQCDPEHLGLYQKQGFTPLHKATHGELSTWIMRWANDGR